MKRIKISSKVMGTLELSKGKVLRGHGWTFVDKVTEEMRWMSGLKLIRIEEVVVPTPKPSRREERERQKSE